MQKQRGYVFRAGDWWYIKYRDTVIDTIHALQPLTRPSGSNWSEDSSRLQRRTNG